MRIAFAIIFIILWWLGVVGTYALGRNVDLLLVIAVILLVLEMRRGADWTSLKSRSASLYACRVSSVAWSIVDALPCAH